MRSWGGAEGGVAGLALKSGSAAGSFGDSFLSPIGGVAKTARPPTPTVSVQATAQTNHESAWSGDVGIAVGGRFLDDL